MNLNLNLNLSSNKIISIKKNEIDYKIDNYKIKTTSLINMYINSIKNNTIKKGRDEYVNYSNININDMLIYEINYRNRKKNDGQVFFLSTNNYLLIINDNNINNYLIINNYLYFLLILFLIKNVNENYSIYNEYGNLVYGKQVKMSTIVNNIYNKNIKNSKFLTRIDSDINTQLKISNKNFTNTIEYFNILMQKY